MLSRYILVTLLAAVTWALPYPANHGTFFFPWTLFGSPINRCSNKTEVFGRSIAGEAAAAEVEPACREFPSLVTTTLANKETNSHPWFPRIPCSWGICRWKVKHSSFMWFQGEKSLLRCLIDMRFNSLGGEWNLYRFCFEMKEVSKYNDSITTWNHHSPHWNCVTLDPLLQKLVSIIVKYIYSGHFDLTKCWNQLIGS